MSKVDTSVINMYEFLPKKYNDKEIKYAAFKTIGIKVPFRALIIGSSGSGKTNLALSLIRLIPVFDKIFLFAANLDEKLYTFLRDWFEAFEEKIGKKVLFFSNALEDVPPIEDFDGSENSLILFDDIVDKRTLKQSNVSAYFTGGRKRGLSCIFMSQTFFGVPDLIRKNVTLIFLKKVSSIKDLTRICREFTLNTSPKELAELYKSVVKGLEDFLLVDLEADADHRFRANWTTIKMIEEKSE